MPEHDTVCNTSPLLYLHLIGQLGLLLELYGEVFIPPAVKAELQAGAARGVDVPQVAINLELPTENRKLETAN